jgi:hypothetical protein
MPIFPSRNNTMIVLAIGSGAAADASSARPKLRWDLRILHEVDLRSKFAVH